MKITEDLYSQMILTNHGSIDWSLKVPFNSTYRRIRVGKERIRKFNLCRNVRDNFLIYLKALLSQKY